MALQAAQPHLEDGAIYRRCWWGYTYRAANVSPGSRNEEDRSDMSRFTTLGHSGAEPHATTPKFMDEKEEGDDDSHSHN